jgi:tetratricopeptide (TPR) repeat protein
MTIQDKPAKRRSRPKPPTTPDPVEIAMEAEASGVAATGEAAALLRRQAILIDEQIGLARNERFRNRIRSIRDIAIAAVVVAFVLAVGAVVWSASRTTGLVIQPFTVPPELVEDGLDGRAVAALFQDELVRLEAATVSARPASSFRNDWSDAITVEVEAGGLSLTDAYRSLVRWLGDETYVDGGLSRTPEGLELVVRTSDGTAVTVQGAADRPGDLLRQAAERVYEQTQPYRYAAYFSTLGNALPQGPERQALVDRRRAILIPLLSSPSPIERLWAHNGLSRMAEVSFRDAIAHLESALEIDPEHPILLGNIRNDTFSLGLWEASLAYQRRLEVSVRDPRHLSKAASDFGRFLPIETEARTARFQGDHKRALEAYTRLTRLDVSQADGYRDDRVQALIDLHQPSGLEEFIAEQAFRASADSAPANGYFNLRGAAAAERDLWPQALAALEAQAMLVAADPTVRSVQVATTSLWPRLAYARARTGDLAGAQTLIAATPLDCYPCVGERARIAELAGDRAAADRWSAEARRQGPSLPFAFAERGQMLMARGDPAGAIAFYEQAVERGPRWADPQKYWGDALMAEGDEAGAIRKYRAAADRAPRWGALHLAWGRALEAQGRREQAREKYAEAARMDLSAADRAEVVRRLGAISARS